MKNNLRVLVTGAAGSIGSAIVRKLLNEGAIVCAFDNNENSLFKLDQDLNHEYPGMLRLFIGDIRDEKRLSKAFEGIDTIFHCAALKHVYLSEYNPFEVMQTNISGTNNVINAAIKANVKKVIYTSSDKAVNPTSTMGASKLLGERLITAANHHAGGKNTRFCSVRFGNVLNTSGSVLHIFKQQINKGIPLTLTSKDMTRFFISMDQAIELCLYASDSMIGGEIFVRNMGCCNILSLAKAISNNDDNFNIIGLKSGEKLYEELVTQNEAERTFNQDSWYTILPDTMDLMEPDNAKSLIEISNNMSKLKCSLRSDQNLMSDDQVVNMLMDL